MCEDRGVRTSTKGEIQAPTNCSSDSQGILNTQCQFGVNLKGMLSMVFMQGNVRLCVSGTLEAGRRMKQIKPKNYSKLVFLDSVVRTSLPVKAQ